MKVLILGIFISCLAASARAESYTAQIIFLGRGHTQSHGATSEKIDVLNWLSEEKVDVHVDLNADEGHKYSVLLQWKSGSEEWAFLDSKNGTIPKDKAAKSYELKVFLNSDSTDEKILAVNQMGDIQTESVQILFPNFPTKKESTEVASKRYWITPLLGLSSIQISQTNIPSLIEWGTTLQVSGKYDFPQYKGKAEFKGSFTVLPFASSLSGITARHLHLNFFATREMLSVSNFYLSLSAGLAYTTLLVTQNYLGYQDVTSPQLFPTFSYRFKSQDQLSFSAKYSPINLGIGLLSLDSRELYFGLEWTHPISEKNGIHVGIDFTNLQINNFLVSGSATLRSNSFQSTTLVAGYNW